MFIKERETGISFNEQRLGILSEHFACSFEFERTETYLTRFKTVTFLYSLKPVVKAIEYLQNKPAYWKNILISRVNILQITRITNEKFSGYFLTFTTVFG